MNYTTVTSDKNKKTALLCCAIGGIFGAHHFYVGNIGKGILYALTAGLMLIGVMIDLIKISSGSFTDNSGAPLRK